MDYVAVVDGGGGECIEVPCYCSFAIESDGNYWEQTFDLPEYRTSNESEYMAVIKALEFLSKEVPPDANILIQSDSKLVVLQCKRKWRVKARNLRPLRARVFDLMKRFGNVEFQWISGKEVKQILGH